MRDKKEIRNMSHEPCPEEGNDLSGSKINVYAKLVTLRDIP